MSNGKSLVSDSNNLTLVFKSDEIFDNIGFSLEFSETLEGKDDWMKISQLKMALDPEIMQVKKLT